jgi:hypothetical protein
VKRRKVGIHQYCHIRAIRGLAIENVLVERQKHYNFLRLFDDLKTPILERNHRQQIFIDIADWLQPKLERRFK